MVRRPRIILATLLLMFIAFSGVVTFRYLNRSNELRDRILTQLEKAVDGDFELENAAVSPSNLILHGFKYDAADSSISVSIEKISIRLLVTNLLKYKGKLTSVVQSVSFSSPQIVLRPDRGGNDDSSEETSTETLSLTELSTVERIILLNGSLAIETGNQSRWVEVSDIEGWITGGEGDNASVDISAALSSGPLRPISIRGDISLTQPLFQGRIDIDPFQLETVQLPESSPINELAGIFELHADVEVNPGGWDGNANWQLSDAAAIIDGNLTLDEINLTGLLENKIAHVQGTARFEGDRASMVEGELDLNGPPTITASAIVPEIHLGKHLGTFTDLAVQDQPTGTVNGRGTLRGDLSAGELYLTAKATTPTMGTVVGDFHNIDLDLSWDNQRHELRFDHITADWFGLDVVGQGRFRPSEHIPFVFDATYEGIPDPTDLPGWTAPLAHKIGSGDFAIRLMPDEGWVLSTEGRVRNGTNPAFGEFQGRYSLYGYDLNLDLYNLRLPDARFHMFSTGDSPMEFHLDQPQIVADWWWQDININSRIARIDMAADVSVNGNTITTRAIVDDGVTGFSMKLAGESEVDTSGQVETVAGYSFRSDSDFIGNGQVDVAYYEDVLTIREFNFLDYISGKAAIDFADRQIEDLLVTFDQVDVDYMFSELGIASAEEFGGSVNGQIRMDGPFEAPDVSGHLELYDGRYGELTDYWALLTISTDENKNVSVETGALGRNGATLFTIIGGYSILEDEYDLYIESPSSDANILLTTLSGKENLIDGRTRLRGQINGSLARPSWSAELSMEEGRLAGVYFDDIDVRLRGETSERLGHVIYIDRFLLERPKHYTLTMQGAAPMDRGAGEVSLLLEGDVLELFPQLTSFISSASGPGHFDWTTTVVAGKPVASRGQLTIENGSAEFDEIFMDLTDLDLEIEVDADGSANIVQARGVFDEQYPFVISNEPGDPDNPARTPILLEIPGIDFGVLNIRTLDNNGIPFRIPGINTTPEYANVLVSGKGDDPWLKLAGPADSLFVEGRIRVQSGTFTYPPLPTEEERGVLASILPQEALDEDDRPAEAMQTPRFIETTRWDANLVIGHDVHYERIVKGLENAPFLETFSSFLGQIVIDVDIEPTEPEYPIQISGQLADESFRLEGTIVSTTGRLEFLDLMFEMDRAEVVFDQTTLDPLISMRAVTNVVEENFSRQMYLTLYVIDPVTGERTQRGRWGEFTFVLEDDAGSSQEEVLSAMGVGIQDLERLQNRVLTAGAGGIDRAVARRWLRPIERSAADWLGLDLVHFRPQFAQNLIGPEPLSLFYEAEDDQRLAANTTNKNLFRASRITLGKYIDRDIFISYTSQFGEEARYASVADIQLGRLGLLQKWNLEYRIEPISPNFILEFGWEYENIEDMTNRSARMKYSVIFDVMALDVRDIWRQTNLN